MRGVAHHLSQSFSVLRCIDHGNLNSTGPHVEHARDVGFKAANHGHDATGTCRPQHVLGGLKIGAAVLVVDNDEIETGIGAHLHNGGAGQAIEDATQGLAAAQHGRQAGINRVSGIHGFDYSTTMLLVLIKSANLTVSS